MVKLMKVHLHSEQFDGALHSQCGVGEKIVMSDAFEASTNRCRRCELYWFPYGQPDFHFQHAVKREQDRS